MTSKKTTLFRILLTKRKLHLAAFWALVMTLTVAVVYALYLDASKRTVQCPQTSPGKTSYLVLRTFDNGPNQIKSTLVIPTFRANENSLEVSTTAPGRVTGVDYEQLVKVSPPAPLATNQSPVTAVPSQPWKVNLSYSAATFFYPFEEYDLNLQLDVKEKDGRDSPVNLMIEWYIPLVTRLLFGNLTQLTQRVLPMH